MEQDPKPWIPDKDYPANTCMTCWHNADTCGCQEPMGIINPTEGVSYRVCYGVSDLNQTLHGTYRRIPTDESVV